MSKVYKPYLTKTQEIIVLNINRVLDVGIVIAVLVFATFAIDAVLNPFVGYDMPIFAVMSRALLHDQTLYVDVIDHKPPMLYIYLAPFLALFGQTILALSLATIVQAVLGALAGIFAVFVLVQDKTARKVGIILAISSAIVLPYYRGFNVVSLMAFFTALSFALAFLARGRSIWLIVAGCLFTAGFWSKQVNAPEALAIFLIAWVGSPAHLRYRSIIFTLVGIIIGLVSIVVWALLNGFWEELWEYAFMANFAYTLSGYLPFLNLPTDIIVPLEHEYNIIEVTKYFRREVIPILLPMLVFSTIAYAATTFGHDKQDRLRRLEVSVSLVWVLTAIVGASIGTALKLVYYGQAFIPLIVFFTLCIEALLATNKGAKAYTFVVISCAIWALSPLTVVQVPEYRYVNNVLTPQSAEIAQRITELTSERDCIFVWGGGVQLSIFLAERNICPSYTLEAFVANIHTFDTRKYRQIFMRDLLHRDPAVLVFNSAWYFFPQLHDYITHYMRTHERFGSTGLFELDFSTKHRVNANFSNLFRLISIDHSVVDQTLPPRSTIRVATHWEALQNIDRYYQMALQIWNDRGENTGGIDVPPHQNLHTQHWRSGEIVIGSLYEIMLPPHLPPGKYSVVLILYDVHTLSSLDVTYAGQTTQSITLFDFEVE